jgi:hypothetical protein
MQNLTMQLDMNLTVQWGAKPTISLPLEMYSLLSGLFKKSTCAAMELIYINLV